MRNKIKIWNKEGVMGDLHPRLQKELGKIIQFHEDDGCINFYITSKIGQAVDFPSDIPYIKLKPIIGPDFDLVSFIIDDIKYFHLEYDQKNDKF